MQTGQPTQPVIPATAVVGGAAFSVRLGKWPARADPAAVGGVAIDVRVDAATARKRVSGWASGEVSTACGGGVPELVLEVAPDPAPIRSILRAYWRVPVLLTRPGAPNGVVGEVGSVQVDVQTGEMDVNAALAALMLEEAARLAKAA